MKEIILFLTILEAGKSTLILAAFVEGLLASSEHGGGHHMVKEQAKTFPAVINLS